MSLLFSPLTIRSVTIPNRLWVSPMCMYSAGSDGVPIYRMYNPLMTENGGAYAHLWTGDFNEYTVLAANHSWKQEGTAWFAESLDEE